MDGEALINKIISTIWYQIHYCSKPNQYADCKTCSHHSISGMLLCLWTAQQYGSWLSWLTLSSSQWCRCRLSSEKHSDICLQPKSFIGKKDAQENWIIHQKIFQKYAGYLSEMIPKGYPFWYPKSFFLMFLQCFMGGDSLILHGPFFLCRQSL